MTPAELKYSRQAGSSIHWPGAGLLPSASAVKVIVQSAKRIAAGNCGDTLFGPRVGQVEISLPRCAISRQLTLADYGAAIVSDRPREALGETWGISRPRPDIVNPNGRFAGLLSIEGAVRPSMAFAFRAVI